MSVVVIGMDYPDNCCVCKMKSWDIDDYVCPFSGVNTLSIGRQTNCPLRPLPEKHGRLGDLDELQSSFRESIDKCKKWIKELEENGDNETLALANQAFCTFVEAKLRLKSIPAIVEAEGE